MKKTAVRLLEDKRGAGLTEYLILVGLIAVVCIAAFTEFGEAVQGRAEEFAGEVEGL